MSRRLGELIFSALGQVVLNPVNSNCGLPHTKTVLRSYVLHGMKRIGEGELDGENFMLP